MRIIALSTALFIGGMSAPALANGLAAGKAQTVVLAPVEDARSSGGRGFRRCMRAKYGPRYFARVPRAHRWHMAQACQA